MANTNLFALRILHRATLASASRVDMGLDFAALELDTPSPSETNAENLMSLPSCSAGHEMGMLEMYGAGLIRAVRTFTEELEKILSQSA